MSQRVDPQAEATHREWRVVQKLPPTREKFYNWISFIAQLDGADIKNTVEGLIDDGGAHMYFSSSEMRFIISALTKDADGQFITYAKLGEQYGLSAEDAERAVTVILDQPM